jgi:predicted transcriptional regulator
MKSVMLSIRPKWCEKIVSGEKTIEVRKTKPKLETPFKAYIYCSQGNDARRLRGSWGKVIGEFTCDRIYKIDKDSTDFLFKAGGLSVYKQAAEEKCGLCVAMTDDELHGYLGHCQGYGWHISDLCIYDEARELSEFTGLRNTRFGAAPYDIKRPPQSWCYVEEWEGKKNG